MRILKQFVIPAAFFLAILSISGCVDALEPAGPAQYVNPEYPSELLGYASIPAKFSSAYFYQNRLYILDSTFENLISFSIADPNLSDPENPVQKDTLDLGFAPGISCFDQSTATLFISEAASNDIYRLPLSGGGSPELLYQCESIITDIFPVNSGSSILICFLGPEWMVRKINSVTGQVEKEYSTQWPIGRAALSVDGERLLVNNSAKKYIIEIDTDSFQKLD